MKTSAKTILLFGCVLAFLSSAVAQRKQNNKKQGKPKVAETRQDQHFNVAAFSNKRTLVQEKHRIPGTDSIVTEAYYVWLLPG